MFHAINNTKSFVMRINYFIINAISIISLVSCQTPKNNPADFVNPFIGTDGHGHTFPGATLPFGMVQLSPDTRKDSWDGCSGYHYSDRTILGFSHTHLSGTGVGDYGDIRFMPTTGALLLVPGEESNTATGYRSGFSHENEDAEPGYYRVMLDDYGIQVELTSTERVGFHRYSMPKASSSQVIIDLSEGITSDEIIDSELIFENDTIVSGYRVTKGWATNQAVYFYAVFSKPFESFGIQANGEKHENVAAMRGNELVGWAGFKDSDNEKVLVKVGISAVDKEGAKTNLMTEVPHWNFDKVRDEAKEKWNESLGKIEVKSIEKSDLKVFYTALYHTMIAPNIFNDVDGRYRGHDGKLHQAKNESRYTVFSLWDTFRALHPLLTIIERDRTASMIRTMLDIYEKGGLLPVWELAGNETWCMIGYHAVPVIADAWVNNIRDFDSNLALEAMRKSALHDHHGLFWYKKMGFIPSDEESESVSKTLEYAYDDWTIATFAKGLGDTITHHEFLRRAQSYKNLYDPETKFFRGRQNGGFVEPFDPTQVNFMLTEANTWQYNFFVLQDINTHIELMGGDAEYEQMLDGLFHSESALTGRKQSDITGLIGQYAHGNEPSHHIAYLYNYIGKPYKTQKLVKQIMDELYSEKPDGLSGNEDCGQMSAWYVMSAMGFYPVTPASGYYVIGTPRFQEMTIHLENGKTFSIKAVNFHPDNYYIQSVNINGNPYNKSWLTHDQIQQGGEMVFEMGSEPNVDWGSLEKNRPVQRIEGENIASIPVIKSTAKTFTKDLEISMGHLDSNAVIFYTINAGTPNLKGSKYEQPFKISINSRIRAVAAVDGQLSDVVLSEFFKIPADRSILLETPFNDLYPAGGDQALIDRQRGTRDFRTGSWQGYYGNDLVAMVDLGKLTMVSHIEAGFLQDQNSWIFLPQWVEFSTSQDGIVYTSSGKLTHDVSPKEEGGIIHNFVQEIKNQPARYIRITAKNRGVCPDWHIGQGEPAWIFADEIVVE